MFAHVFIAYKKNTGGGILNCKVFSRLLDVLVCRVSVGNGLQTGLLNLTPAARSRYNRGLIKF